MDDPKTIGMQTLREAQAAYVDQLRFLYELPEINSIFRIVIKERLNLSTSHLLINSGQCLRENEQVELKEILVRLCKAEPIQYILGHTEFYGLKLHVTPDTLIPRPETEELVDRIIGRHKSGSNLRVLDIGTGSGCIAIALAKNLPSAQVTAYDISTEALVIAKKNAEANQVNVTWQQVNILECSELPENLDIIISNPPYVRELEKNEIHKNVLEYEPHNALFVPNEDPLRFYRKIAELAQNALPKGGRLYFEINQYLPEEMKHLFTHYDFHDIRIRKDLSGKYRFAEARR